MKTENKYKLVASIWGEGVGYHSNKTVVMTEGRTYEEAKRELTAWFDISMVGLEGYPGVTIIDNDTLKGWAHKMDDNYERGVNVEIIPM